MAVRAEKAASLVDSLCARVRERVDDEHAEPGRGVRPPVLPLGPRRGPRRPQRRSTSTAPRSRTGTSRAAAPAGRAEGPRLQPDVRAARLAVDAHGGRDRQRRHAVPRRLARDGGQPPRLRHPPASSTRSCASAATTTASCSRSCPATPSVGAAESVIHVEIDRQTEPAELDALRDDLLHVLDEVRAAVEDWPRMTEQARDLAAELDEPAAARSPTTERHEANALLEWLADDHFVFLGYREYELVDERRRGARCARVPGTGLGILRQKPRRAARSQAFGRAVRSACARSPARRSLLILTKANSRATVHRPAYLDYIGVKRFDADGEVVGERRFLGLYTSARLQGAPARDPAAAPQDARACSSAPRFPPGSHDEKALVDILETLPARRAVPGRRGRAVRPRDGRSSRCGERQPRAPVRARATTYERFLSLPRLPAARPLQHAEPRAHPARSCATRSARESVDFSLRVDRVGARAHPLHGPRRRRASCPTSTSTRSRQRIVEVTRSWTDALHDALVEDAGEEAGNRLFRRYGDAFPTAYRADWLARSAVADVQRIEELRRRPTGSAMTLYRPLEAGGERAALQALPRRRARSRSPTCCRCSSTPG